MNFLTSGTWSICKVSFWFGEHDSEPGPVVELAMSERLGYRRGEYDVWFGHFRWTDPPWLDYSFLPNLTIEYDDGLIGNARYTGHRKVTNEAGEVIAADVYYVGCDVLSAVESQTPEVCP